MIESLSNSDNWRLRFTLKLKYHFQAIHYGIGRLDSALC